MPSSTLRDPTSSKHTTSNHRSPLDVNEAVLTYGSGIYDLLLRAPHRQFKNLARVGAEFALLLVEEPLVALAFRFGERSSWTLAPFVSTGDGSRDRTPPSENDSDRALISIRRDANDSPPIPVRNYTLSLDFSRALNSAVRDSLSRPLSPSESWKALSRLTHRFPRLDSLIARAAIRSPGSL